MLGLARSFGLEVLPDLRKALEAGGVFGSDAIANHPVTQVWVSKLHSLANMGISEVDRFYTAYEACQHLAAGQAADGTPSDAVLEVLATPGSELGKS
jgi:hypothetical protein